MALLDDAFGSGTGSFSSTMVPRRTYAGGMVKDWVSTLLDRTEEIQQKAREAQRQKEKEEREREAERQRVAAEREAAIVAMRVRDAAEMPRADEIQRGAVRASLLARADDLARDPSVSFMPSWYTDRSSRVKSAVKKYGEDILSPDIRRAVAERRGVPGEAFDRIEAQGPQSFGDDRDEFRRALQKQDEYLSKQPGMGLLSKAVGKSTEKALGGGTAGKVGGMLTGGLTRGLEIAASGVAQGALEVAGKKELAQKVDVAAGTRFRTNPWETNVALGADAATTILSLAIGGGATSGVVRTFLKNAAVNAAVDIPGTYVSAALYAGYSPEDIAKFKPLKENAQIRQAILLTLAGDVGAGGAAAIGPGVRALRGAGKEVPEAVIDATGRNIPGKPGELVPPPADNPDFRGTTPEAMIEGLNSNRLSEMWQAEAVVDGVLNPQSAPLQIAAPTGKPVWPPQEQPPIIPPELQAMFHGNAEELTGPLRKDAWVTPNPKDAQKFAEAAASLSGGEPIVHKFDVKPEDLRPGEEGLTSFRGSMQVANPEGIVASGNYRPIGDGKFSIIPANEAPRPPQTLKEALDRRAPPTGEQLASDPAAAAFVKEADDFIRAADAQTKSRHIAARAAPGIGGIVDPGSKFRTAAEKGAHSVSLAAANFERATLDTAASRLGFLRPLMGSTVSRDLLKAATEITPPAIGLAYALSDGSIGGWKDEMAIASGFGAMALLSVKYRRGALKPTPWAKVPLTENGKLELPVEYQKVLDTNPSVRFADIIEHPARYDLNPKQYDAITALQKFRDEQLDITNAARRAAGLPQIARLEENRLFHAFDTASLEKQFGKDWQHSNPFIEMQITGKIQASPISRPRELGNTWEDVIAEYPELRPPKNVEEIFAAEQAAHVRERQRALLAKGLQDKGIAKWLPDPDTLKDAERDAALAELAATRKKGWVAIPGMGNIYADPGASRVVDNLLSTSREGNAAFNGFDVLTNEIRTALFSLDLSPWTLQGGMLMIQHPIMTLTHMHDLILNSFSEKAMRSWENRNLSVAGVRLSGGKGLRQEASKAGVNTGRSPRGFNVEGAVNPGRLPLIEKLENAGFNRFLPTMRSMVFDAQRKTEAFIEAVPGGKVPVIGELLRKPELVLPSTYAAYQTARGEDIDTPTLAVLFMAGAGAGLMRDYVGAKAWDRLSPEKQAAAGARAGKLTNRTGSILNREQMGMSASQAKIERTLVFRSPSMTRNALSLVALAATNPGAEGQAARAYLMNTAMAYTATLAAAKFIFTGELDSFSPNDDDSILNPKNLLKVEVPGYGKFSPANPLISLIRAALYQDPPDDQRDGYDMSRWTDPSALLHDKGQGLEQFLTGRTTDVIGPVANPQIESAFDQITGGRNRVDTAPTGPTEANPGGFALEAMKNFVPLPIQAASESGLLAKTEIGGAIANKVGAEPNKNFNSVGEAAAYVAANLVGLNATPETLAQQLIRLRDDAVVARFGEGTDYYALNDRERAKVNANLAGDERYTKLRETLDAKGAKPSPVDAYFTEKLGVNDDYTKRLTDAQKAVEKGTMTRAAFREFYQEQARTRRTQLESVDKRYADISAERPGTKESVIDYLSRNTQPEDRMVERYFSLFDKAEGAGGTLDFDKLEVLQEKFKKGLSAGDRQYLNRRLADFDKPETNTLVAEYGDVKKELEPYWEIRDQVFGAVHESLPFFQQFSSSAEFDSFLNQSASKVPGMTADDVLDLLASKSKEVKLYAEAVSNYQKSYRIQNPLADIALVDWYERAPADRVRYAAMSYGIEVPIEFSAGVLSGKRSNSAADTLPAVSAIAQSGQKVPGSLYEYWKKRLRTQP